MTVLTNVRPQASPMVRLGLTLAFLVMAAVARPAAAQLPSPDGGALGSGTASPALARGFGAVAVNPAALGAPDGPAFSVTALSVGLRNGLDPVRLGDLARWDGREMPRRVRVSWLDRVVARGSQSGAAGLDLTLAAVSRGRFGFQISTRAHGRLSLNPDAAELLLFGNAGLDGAPRELSLAGSRGEGWVVTTGGMAYGRPAGRLGRGRLHLGGTLTFSVGHAVGVGRDNGSGLGGDPTELDLRFPIVHVASAARGLDHGHGVGLDVGALWTGAQVTLGAVVRNVFNTFSWTVEDLSFRPGAAVFAPDGSSSDFDERPAEEAPPVLLDALDGLTFRRGLALGAAWASGPDLTLHADLTLEGGGGLAVEPDLHLGVGAERRARENILLRAGIGLMERGVQLSAGAVLQWGRVDISGAGGLRTGALDDLLLGTLGVSYRGR